jgi:Cof subfamily protein (haloacid dehalogenase superfamily)
VNKSGTISEEDRKALEEARRAGIQISLCTGRVASACLKVLDQLSLDGYHIFFDGALVCDRKFKEIYSRPISPELVHKASELALRDGLLLDLFTSTDYYVMKKSWRSDIRRDFFCIDSKVADFNTLWQTERIIKCGLLVSSEEEVGQALALSGEFSDQLNFSWTTAPAYPRVQFINIIDQGVSKGEALRALAAHLKIDISEVAAIGDGANDETLLSEAGLAIAMQNSPPGLKLRADFIAADVDNSGVAEAIRKFLL